MSSSAGAIHKAISHLNTLDVKRIGVVHVNDTFGADGLAGAQAGFKANQLEALFIEKFDRAKPDFSAVAPRVAAKEPQAVIFIGTGAAVVDGIKALRGAGVTGQIVTLSNNASGGFVKALGEQARGVVVTQVFPSERSLNHAVIKEAMDLARARNVGELTPAMVEGFVNAKVLVEGLKRAGAKPDRAKLHAGLESIKKWDLGGMELSYSATDHSGLTFSDLAIIGPDGRFRDNPQRRMPALRHSSYSTANSFSRSSGSRFLPVELPSMACAHDTYTRRRSSLDWQAWMASISEMRLWCPKMVLTVLVMKLRAISTSLADRLCAGGRSASSGFAAAVVAGAAAGAATAVATGAMHSRESNSSSKCRMSLPATKAPRSLPVLLPSTRISTRRASTLRPSDRV